MTLKVRTVLRPVVGDTPNLVAQTVSHQREKNLFFSPRIRLISAGGCT
jgi:hypothetical protein